MRRAPIHTSIFFKRHRHRILLAIFVAVAGGCFWQLPPGCGGSGGGSVPYSLAVARVASLYAVYSPAMEVLRCFEAVAGTLSLQRETAAVGVFIAALLIRELLLCMQIILALWKRAGCFVVVREAI